MQNLKPATKLTPFPTLMPVPTYLKDAANEFDVKTNVEQMKA
jgi:hypothetical protein